MVRLLAILIALAGCNQVFGLESTVLLDAKVIDPNNPDAFRPVLPPDGSTSCTGAPVFEAWTYAARTTAFTMPVGTFGLYARSGSSHMIATPATGAGVWDVDVVGNTAMQIDSLMPPSGKSISSVAVSPEGAAIWFKIDAATYVALRVNGFAREQTELGIPNAYEILPSNPGFYDGALRMVVRLRDAISDPVSYVEIVSTDGVTWTRGDTLPFGGSGYFAASMSADGCMLTLARMDTGSSYALYYAYRSADGKFLGPLIKLDAATTVGGSFPINPALAPGSTSLWFSTGQDLIEGHP